MTALVWTWNAEQTWTQHTAMLFYSYLMCNLKFIYILLVQCTFSLVEGTEESTRLYAEGRCWNVQWATCRVQMVDIAKILCEHGSSVHTVVCHYMTLFVVCTWLAEPVGWHRHAAP